MCSSGGSRISPRRGRQLSGGRAPFLVPPLDPHCGECRTWGLPFAWIEKAGCDCPKSGLQPREEPRITTTYVLLKKKLVTLMLNVNGLRDGDQY